MDTEALAAEAVGASVTAERLEAAPLGGLAGDERPHHLLRANSVEFGTAAADARLYPRMDEYAWVVVTDRRVHLVVEGSVESRHEALSLDALREVEAEWRLPRRLTLRTAETSYVVNLVDEDDPEPVGEFLRAPAAALADAGVDDGRGPDGDATPEAETGGDASAASDAAPTSRRERADSGTDPGEGGAPDDPLDKLERLAALRDDGILTDEEFAAKKAELLEQV